MALHFLAPATMRLHTALAQAGPSWLASGAGTGCRQHKIMPHMAKPGVCVCVCDCTRETVSTFGMCSANIQEKVILVANIFNTYSVRGPFSWNGPQIASSGNKLDRRRGQSRLTRGAGFPLGKIRICVRGKILQHCVGRRVRI